MGAALADVHPPTVLEARSPRPKCRQGRLLLSLQERACPKSPLLASKSPSSPASSRRVPSGFPRCHGRTHRWGIVWGCLCVYVSPFSEPIRLDEDSPPRSPRFTVIMPLKVLFPNTVTCRGPGVRTSTWASGGPSSAHTDGSSCPLAPLLLPATSSFGRKGQRGRSTVFLFLPPRGAAPLRL